MGATLLYSKGCSMRLLSCLMRKHGARCAPYGRCMMLIKSINASLSRRKFLQVSGGTVLAATAPFGLLSRAADAAEEDGRILVIVQLYGGNDGLNTLVPYNDPNYYANRPNIAISPQELAATRITDAHAYHPSLGAFYRFYQQGLICNLQGVGYPNQNRSHFFSTDIWRTAHENPLQYTDGWVGRIHDVGCDGAAPESILGVRRLDKMLISGDYTAPAIETLATFNYTEQNSNPKLTTKYIEQAFAFNDVASDSNLQYVIDSGQLTQAMVESLGRAANYTPARTYPNTSFGVDLKLVSQIINTDHPTRIFHTGFSGFDTHSNQLGTHATLLNRLGDSLEAFYLDLRDNNRHRDVLILTVSEFGRRLKDNASAGCDHGAASVHFAIGGAIRRTFVGANPDLRPEALYRGDLAYSLDFRSIYAEVLDRWLGCDSEMVLGGYYPPANFLADPASAVKGWENLR